MSRQAQWQVTGSAAEVYEKELVPAIFGPWAELVIDLADPQKGDRVLDVACGTGIIARTVADRVGPTGAVVGVDLNPGMLKVARTRSPEPSGRTARTPAHKSSGKRRAPTNFHFPMRRSMSPIASSACSSLPIGPRRCARCTAFSLPAGGSWSWYGAT